MTDWHAGSRSSCVCPALAIRAQLPSQTQLVSKADNRPHVKHRPLQVTRGRTKTCSIGKCLTAPSEGWCTDTSLI